MTPTHDHLTPSRCLIDAVAAPATGGATGRDGWRRNFP